MKQECCIYDPISKYQHQFKWVDDSFYLRYDYKDKRYVSYDISIYIYTSTPKQNSHVSSIRHEHNAWHEFWYFCKEGDVGFEDTTGSFILGLTYTTYWKFTLLVTYRVRLIVCLGNRMKRKSTEVLNLKYVYSI